MYCSQGVPPPFSGQIIPLQFKRRTNLFSMAPVPGLLLTPKKIKTAHIAHFPFRSFYLFLSSFFLSFTHTLLPQFLSLFSFPFPLLLLLVFHYEVVDF